MSEFWNQRFSIEDYVYGKDANLFFKEQLDRLEPGTILFPAEGEGRNAVYAAGQGWEVQAFDPSTSGREKALRLAKEQEVIIKYDIADVSSMDYPAEHFDCIALVFAHFPVELRQEAHRKLMGFLKPGGVIILEAFHKTHLKRNLVNPKAGGPKDINMLFDEDMLQSDFKGVEFEILKTETVHIKEGVFHDGLSDVIRMVGRKMGES